jgi:predicted transcriptional regulator of viral defense system
MSVSVKIEKPYLERLRKILEEQHGMILTSDLARFGIPRTYLSIMEKNGEIERVSTGVYKKTDSIEDELFSLQARYSVSVYSHETALYLHDLTDRTPLTYSVTVPTGYHTETLNASGCKVYYVNRKLIELGVVYLESPHGNEIRVTGLERTMVDLFRNRNSMDIQLFNDALKRYVGRKERNLDLLYTYARKFRVQQIARQYLEVLL